jgi:sterol desaturase/sphingolipid hydroxylase (fatty acid hydroxylase superfamily)
MAGMRLGRVGYYSDFVVYPALILALAGAGLKHDGARASEDWVSLFLLFLGLWTLIEYLMHRFVLHHVPYLRVLHEEHHRHESEPIGTPTYISLGLHALLIFIPMLALFGFAAASAAASGLMLGYFWYISVHHILHHWHPDHSGYVYGLKRHHALHHHLDGSSNFGVTTGFWDRALGTFRR